MVADGFFGCRQDGATRGELIERIQNGVMSQVVTGCILDGLAKLGRMRGGEADHGFSLVEMPLRDMDTNGGVGVQQVAVILVELPDGCLGFCRVG